MYSINRISFTFSLCISLIFGFSGAANAQNMISGHPHVYDGDTLFFKDEHVRLDFIDAPEIGQICKDESGASYDGGKFSRDLLSMYINGRSVSCKWEHRGIYDRPIGKCWVDGDNIDFSSLMLNSGAALALTKYVDPQKTQYAKRLERHAKASKLGIWRGECKNPKLLRKSNINKIESGFIERILENVKLFTLYVTK